MHTVIIIIVGAVAVATAVVVIVAIVVVNVLVLVALLLPLRKLSCPSDTTGHEHWERTNGHHSAFVQCNGS